MGSFVAFLKEYRAIEKPVMCVIMSEFFIQMVNATFMNILPLYMTKEGYSDEEIAWFITFRFIGVFMLALPLGKFIRGKRLIPFFFLSNIFIPIFGLMTVLSIGLKCYLLSCLFLFLWGASLTFMQIPVAPFILRNSSKHHHTAGISLSYSTWSFGGIVSGLIIAALDRMDPAFFNEKMILMIFSVLGFGGIFYLGKIKKFDEIHHDTNDPAERKITDWKLILRALVPTLIIATGAGLTIPFISLFFQKVHHMDKGGFSFLSSVAAILVAYGALQVPKIKKTIGYKVAIPSTQSLAVISLVALATTELYSQYSIAIVVAAACYLLRQPLMNMAGPMTTEVVLKYVGPANREITSALTSAIWSGSWVLSGMMVSLMLSQGYRFVNIFLITSLLYAFGVIMYYLLILDYNNREKKGLLQD